jgi:hypothetical protein
MVQLHQQAGFSAAGRRVDNVHGEVPPQDEAFVSSKKELPATSSQLKALSWHCFPPFDSSPNGEPLIGERIRQVAHLPPLEAGG